MGNFRKGMIDALPVFAGYLSVGFTFGIKASADWASSVMPPIASMLHISGTGQFVLLSLLEAGSTTAAIATGVVAINLRYVPMALAVSQRLSPSTSILRRLAIALGDTDEIVGISLKHPAPLPFAYMMGLLVCSWLGWVGGTVLGANPATASIMPQKLTAAFGVAFPAMFAAIVLPAARASRPVCVAAAGAAVLSLATGAMRLDVDPGWITLFCGIAAAVVAALLPAADSRESDRAEENGGDAP